VADLLVPAVQRANDVGHRVRPEHARADHDRAGRYAEADERARGAVLVLKDAGQLKADEHEQQRVEQEDEESQNAKLCSRELAVECSLDRWPTMTPTVTAAIMPETPSSSAGR
jgi:hypothetical protein